jgi:hypothetical protein
MGPTDLAIAILVVLAGILASAAYGAISVSPADFRKARICFVLATICIVGVAVVWGLSTTQPFWVRLIAAGLIGSIASIGLTEALRWVANREAMIIPSDIAAVSPAPPLRTKPWKHELEDLYNSDFNHLLSTQQEWEIRGSETPSDDPTPIIVKMRFRIYQDFNSGSDFVSIFIPVSHNIKTDDKIYELIQFVRDQIPTRYHDLKNSVGVGMAGPGLPYSEGKDLRFSGRVFIYTMQPFTPIQIGELMRWYQDAGLSLQIRGSDYWNANKDR